MQSNYKNEYKNSYQDDEIDLGRVFFKLIFIIKRRFKLIFLGTLFGAILGLLYYFITPPVYFSNLTISTGMLTSSNSKSLFSTLQTLIDERNYGLLSRQMNLSLDDVKKLKRITVQSLAKDEEDPDRANLFLIEVYVTSRDVLGNLQNGIIFYLEENPYVKKRIDLKKKNIISLAEKIEKELVGLDSLKEQLSANVTYSRNENNVVILDPVNVYRETVSLFQRNLELQAELELIDNIQVIQNFTFFERPVSPRLRVILFGILGGLFIAFSVVVVLEIIEFSRTYKISEVA